MRKTRTSIPQDLVDEAMFASDSTCCNCRERGKAVQIHHIDENPTNNGFENLAVLCLQCHNETQIQGGFGRKLSASLVTKYRNDWLQRVQDRRDAADRAAVKKMSGTELHGSSAIVRGSTAETTPNSEERADKVLAYVDSLPERLWDLRKVAQNAWDTGATATILDASYDYIDALQGILIALSKFYPEDTFGENPREFFSELVASRFRWHHAHAEPHGPGTGGTIVSLICSRNVVTDAERMVYDMATSVVGYDDGFNWRAWDSRWKGKLGGAEK